MLNRPTLRLHGVALAVASWAVLAWSQAVPGPFDRFGTLRGVDFLQFYAAGWFVWNGRADALYDWEGFAKTLPTLAPGIGETLFLPVYPPQLALVFAPFGKLSYLPALAAWTLVSAALYIVAVWAAMRMWPALRTYRREAWCFALGFTPFLQLIAHGQVASLAMPLLVAAFYGFRAGGPLVVGVALGSLVFKPQFGAFAMAAMTLWPSGRLMIGLALGCGLQLGLVVAFVGTTVLRDYLGVLQRLAASAGQFEPKIWAMHSMRGAFELLLGQGRLATACWLLGAVGVVWLARRAWHRHQSLEVRFALICVVGLILNPHLYIYDLVLMAVPLACLAAWLVQHQDPANVRVPYLVYGLVWLPLLGPLAAITHVQLTSPALVALLWQLGLTRRVAPTSCSAGLPPSRKASADRRGGW
jgi:alpha-1,2-mannosyltransferase